MLTAKVNDNTDNASRARLLSLRAVVSRILGDLHKALADAKLALAHAEATGELRRIAICQARLANVLQWRGEYAEADRLFAEANSSELPDRLRGTMHSHAGRSAYDQGRYMEACNALRARARSAARKRTRSCSRPPNWRSTPSSGGSSRAAGDPIPVRVRKSCRSSSRRRPRWTSRRNSGASPTPTARPSWRPGTPTSSRSATASPGSGGRSPRPGS